MYDSGVVSAPRRPFDGAALVEYGSERQPFVMPYTGHEHLEIWRWKIAEPTTFVYVIRPAHDTAIKVGLARDVLARMAELQTGNPRRLNLMYVLPGDRHLEKGLHRCLKGSRRLGEWFDGPEIDPFLESVAQLADRMIERHDQMKQMPDVYELAADLLPLTRPKVSPVPKVSAMEQRRRSEVQP